MLSNFHQIDSENIYVLAPRTSLYFYDSQTKELPQYQTPLEAWQSLMAHPMPLLRVAFKIRDRIAGWFGVHAIGGFSGQEVNEVRAGDSLDFFKVEYINDTVMLLSERDRHLDVLTCVSTKGSQLTITSSVMVHNWFGRIYMVPVAPAHRVIVRRMLNRLVTAQEAHSA
ncbi:hypothetical protein GCM10007939_08770 [Amylibacter marinus]|uniref:DUF2867 domain-containing protein n=1 Tax=Amylibacter marinus TaxID=1475483 RepID=A0ABQ5VTV8_9RHOB|nr:DUF2867 domain-containing protein [Amylibacter marinus]GLQ34594.1 hypothetical protein GCM10007939_08770 [Amylibacter marinus]